MRQTYYGTPHHRKKTASLVARIEHALAYGLACSFIGLSGLTALVVLYWLKAAAGIDLVSGPSLLHGLFY